MFPRWAPWVAAGAVLLIAKGSSASGSRRKRKKTPKTPAPGPTPTGDVPDPIAVGMPSDPEVGALLAEMDALFEAQGVDTSLASAREVTKMPKAPGQPSAIPPKYLWPRMAATLRNLVIPLRLKMGIPFSLRGYRPADYNAAVGGVPGSRHQWFEGVDIYLAANNTKENRRKLALEGAKMYLSLGPELKVGFGAYGSPTPSNIHLDSGYDMRTWEEGDFYVAQV